MDCKPDFVTSAGGCPGSKCCTNGTSRPYDLDQLISIGSTLDFVMTWFHYDVCWALMLSSACDFARVGNCYNLHNYAMTPPHNDECITSKKLNHHPEIQADTHRYMAPNHRCNIHHLERGTNIKTQPRHHGYKL